MGRIKPGARQFQVRGSASGESERGLTFVFDRPPGEVGPDEGGLGDHALPPCSTVSLRPDRTPSRQETNAPFFWTFLPVLTLLSRQPPLFIPRPQPPPYQHIHLEQLLFADTPDLGDRHGKPGGLLGALVLDLGAQGLGGGGVGAVEQVGRDGVGGLLLGGGALDVALLVLLDGLAHLDLLRVALLGVQLGPQAAQVLGILALLVALARGLLARALLVVEALAVELAVALCGGRTAGLAG